jgi:pteridine reductase
MMPRPVAMITGATRRLGLAIARRFAQVGFDLELTSRSRDDAALDQLSREFAGLGARTRWHPLNLDDLSDVDRWAKAWARGSPALDVLVHNASSYAESPLEDIRADQALAHFRVNALAPLLLSKHFARRLAESSLPHGGAIVAMLDIHAIGRPRRNYLGYAMSKAALAEMTRGLAIELAPRVRVNGVAPGVIGFAESGPDADPAMQASYLKRVPLQRAGTFEEAAEIVRWLAMDAAYVTGQVVRIDGGRWLT